MTRARETLPADYFDRLYEADPDPWQFRTSRYERDKYEATLGALAKERYGSALEVGCSIGILTDLLAGRCDELLAIDGSEIALAAARKFCACHANVIFDARMVPEGFPDGRFDLIVLSEVLYYLEAGDLDRLAAQCTGALAPGGHIVSCHWLGETDYPSPGKYASDRFASAMLRQLPVRTILREGAYRLERLSA